MGKVDFVGFYYTGRPWRSSRAFSHLLPQPFLCIRNTIRKAEHVLDNRSLIAGQQVEYFGVGAGMSGAGLAGRGHGESSTYGEISWRAG